MKRVCSSLAVLAAAWLSASAARAQSTTEMWTEVGASYALSDRAELELDGHLRFGRGPQIIAAMPELGVDFEVYKWLELGAGYRLEYERDDGAMEGGHRSLAQAQLETALGDLELGYRLRYQYQLAGFAGGDGSRHTVRQRAGLGWGGFGAWEPYIDTELYLRLGDGEGIATHKQRFTLGTDYDFGDQALGAFYRVDAPYDGDPLTHILGLEFHVDL